MHISILEAVRKGHWDYEPPEMHHHDYSRTEAMPGTRDKLEIMAERVRQGLPLWHPEDQREQDEDEYRREESLRLEAVQSSV